MNVLAKIEGGKKPQQPSLNVVHKSASLYTKLVKKETTIAVIGMGYTGLPLAMELAREFRVIGYDIDSDKVEQLRDQVDVHGEFVMNDFKGRDLRFFDAESHLSESELFIIAVPTPVDGINDPEFTQLKKATATVAQFLKPGAMVIFESTVYPGCTDEVTIPLLERISGLQVNEDFHVGYSPQRAYRGDRAKKLLQSKKIVAASNPDAAKVMRMVYDTVIRAGIVVMDTILQAEAVQALEKAQLDINRALLNEISQVYDAMGLDMGIILQAAATNPDFHGYLPGFYGGETDTMHPYHLIYKARKLGMDVELLTAAREVNQSMPDFCANKIADDLHRKNIDWKSARVLVKGVTYRENIADVRESQIADLVRKLRGYGMELVLHDPVASPKDMEKFHEMKLTADTQIEGLFDVVIIGAAHREYLDGGITRTLQHRVKQHVLVMDLTSQCRHLVPPANYYSL